MTNWLNYTISGIKIIILVKLYPRGYRLDVSSLYYTLSGTNYGLIAHGAGVIQTDPGNS